VCGGAEADDFIDEAFASWRLSSKTQIFVGRASLTDKNLARKMCEFKARQLRSLKLHPIQTIRLMCLSGHYVLGPELASKGVHLLHCPFPSCVLACSLSL
jgi:hypothetical protein